MTKIKTTKKGMAKKTLSMSLVLAMLATSNVPVWAADFSDGTDTAVAAEAEAPVVDATEEFSDDAAEAETQVAETEAPVVEDNTEAVVDAAEATNEKALYFEKAEIGTPVSFAADSVLKNSEGKTVTVFDYEWLIDGVQPANEDGTPMTNSGQVRLGGSGSDSNAIKGAIASFTPQAHQLGGKLSLKITGVKGTNEDFEGFTYTTPAVTITAKDITKMGLNIQQNGTLTYDGTAKTLDSSNVTIASNADNLTVGDFIFTYNGDTVNATEPNKPVRVTATVNKAGYTGSLSFDMTISPKTLAVSSGTDLTDKTANDLAVNLKKTQYKYTGGSINLLTNVADNFTLKSNLSGNTLSSNAITSYSLVDGNSLLNVGDSAKIKVAITKTGDKELDRNYATGAFNSNNGIGYTTAEKATVVARDLSTCTIDDISIGSLAAKTITKAQIKALVSISEGKENLDGIMGDVDIEVDTDSIHKNGEGTYTVVVKPTDVTKNVVGRKTINLYVAQNNIADANLVSLDGQNATTLNENTTFAEEYYQGGSAIEKTADQLGTIAISEGSRKIILKAGTDYKVIYENNTNAGTASVYLQGISSTLGGKKCIGTFTIQPAVITQDSIAVPETVSYDGSKTEAGEYLKKSDIKVQAETYTWVKKTVGTTTTFEKVKKLIDVPEALYATEFAADTSTLVNNKIADTTKLTTTVKAATGVDTTSDAYKNFSIATLGNTTAAKKTTVSTLSIENADVTVVGAPFVYTGKEITPDLVVKDGDRTLVKDVDYEVVTTVNAKNAGTAKITIKGKGDYSSAKTKTVEFTINKADLSKVTITPKKDAIAGNFTYTGEKIAPILDSNNYDIKLGDVTLSADDINSIKITYPASSSANVNAGKEAGSATLTIKDTAKNPNFEGTNSFKFDIEQAKLLSGGTFTLWKDGKVVTDQQANKDITGVNGAIFTNDGTAHTFDKVTYTPKAGTNYKEGTDYEIKYYNNTRGEVAAIYVNALGNYKNADANKFGDNTTTYTDAKFFKITAISIRKSDVQVADTEYAGGIAVKPTVTVKANGEVLEEGLDYTIETSGDCANVTATDKVLKAKLFTKDGYTFDTATWGAANIKTDAAGKRYVELTWKVTAKDLKNTEVTAYRDENGKVVVTVMNGSVVVPASEYDVKENEDGTVTVTAKATSTNYTGSASATVGKDDTAIGTPVIASAAVSGNKATVTLAGEADGAIAYDYVIGTSADCIETEEYVAESYGQVETSVTFSDLAQDTYYAYCRAWKRDNDGKKVYSNWSAAYPISVTAITPETPVITETSTYTKNGKKYLSVTYTACDGAENYAVVVGTDAKRSEGQLRPVEVKYTKNNIVGTKVTTTFLVKGGETYYVGMRAYNKTGENGKKVYSKWSNIKTQEVK